MEECFFTGTIQQKNPKYWEPGIIGVLLNNTIVRNCYSELSVVTDSIVTNFTINYGNDSKVENCYVTGNTISPKILSPFGYKGNVSSCFWDNEKIVVSDSLGKGLGLSTSDMKKRSTFESAGWDFENVWYIEDGMDYPKLRAFKHDSTVGIIERNPIVDYIFDIFPNPSGYKTEVKYTLPIQCSVSIELVNVLGVLQKEIMINTNHLPGSYKISVDASDLPSGVYFCTLKTPDFIDTKKMVIIK